MDFLRHWILLCEVWNTDLWLLWITCDFIFESMWYFFFLWTIINNPIFLTIIHFVLLLLFLYIPYKYITNRKKDYFFILLFFASLFVLNVKYLILVIILDIILYFIWFIFKKYNHLNKLSNKQLRYYFMYGKFIPILGYLYTFRIWLTNQLSIKQLFSGIIISNINLLFSFIFIWWFLHLFDWFYRSELLNNQTWWESEELLYTKIWSFVIIYLIWILIYLFKYKKL